MFIAVQKVREGLLLFYSHVWRGSPTANLWE